MTHRTVLAIFATALGYCSYRSVSDDLKQRRHSQCQLRSAARNDRFSAPPSAGATTSYY
jgi:hypothetical protein